MKDSLDQFVRRAEDLTELTHDTADQDIFDDDLLAFIRKHFGVEEVSAFRATLTLPRRIYDRSDITRDADRADILQRVQNRLHVLKNQVEKGRYVPPSNAEESKPPAASGSPAKVFISHSGVTPALDRLLRFVRALGVEPIVAEWQPFKGRQVPDHVRSAISQCVAAIVFATSTDQVGERNQPGRGVLIETGLLQERFGEKVTYLLERGVSFGAMADGFAHESFDIDNLEQAFSRIVVELKAHGII